MPWYRSEGEDEAEEGEDREERVGRVRLGCEWEAEDHRVGVCGGILASGCTRGKDAP